MATYPTFGADPGWLGSPKYKNPFGPPQFANPNASNPMMNSIPGLAQYSRPMLTGGGGGGYTNPGSNDPTLAPGYGGGMGGPASGGGLPNGAINPPFQFAGGGMPNWMASAGWKVGRGPNGAPIWLPPGSSQQSPSANLTYY